MTFRCTWHDCFKSSPRTGQRSKLNHLSFHSSTNRGAFQSHVHLRVIGRWWFIVGKMNCHTDCLTAVIRSLAIESHFGPARTRAGQESNHLNPKLTETRRITAKTPTP